MADLIASASSMTTVADGQYVAIGRPKGGLTPSSITAMVGFQRGNGEAIDIAPKVQTAMTVLSEVAAGNVFPANVNAQTALTNLTTVQAKVFNKNDCGGFGGIVSSAMAHCNNSKDLISTTNSLKGQTYPDYGSGIVDSGSMADRGINNTFGSYSSAGSALGSGGTMWNGLDVKDIGTSGGIAQSLQNNKLGNATGLNQKLTEAGVDIRDLTDPAYQDKISSTLSSITDPGAINTSAEQFEQANPFAGLPAYTGTDSSIYDSPGFLTGKTTTTTSTTGSSSTGTSTGATAFGSTSAPEVTTGGIKSLKDLGDYTKTADPATTAGLNTDLAGIGQKLNDLGGGEMIDNQQSSAFFDRIQKIDTPITTAAHPTLESLMSDPATTTAIESLTGIPGGSTAIPTMRDILGPIAGNPAIDDLADGWSEDKVTALNQSTSKADTFIGAASLQASSGTPTQTLGGTMGFATNLHKYGQDNSADGVGSILKNMANTQTKYGESVVASLVEGENNDLFAQNGIGPLRTNPFEGTRTYTGTDGSLYTNPQVKMMGGS